MSKEMIFKVSDELQEKLKNDCIEILSEFTGIEKEKLLDAAKKKSLEYIFECPEEMKLSSEQKDKLTKLRSLRQFPEFFMKRENAKEMDIGTVNKENRIKNFDINKIKNKSVGLNMER